MDAARLERIRDAARRLVPRLSACDLCPRRCGARRAGGDAGVCGAGRLARVASFGPHFGEEAPLVGWNGSGTVFFSGCNLRCAFCQNFEISHGGEGEEVDAGALAGIFLAVQRMGCHNLNLVTPTHVVPQILEALALAGERGFDLPLVYNCGGYESLEVLRLLEGIVDIYMPDVKFLDPARAARYCGAPDYPEVARAAVREMARQVGPLRTGPDGLARAGLLVRHLVMPEDASTTAWVLDFVAEELGPQTYLNLMDQYRPCGRAGAFPEIARRISRAEWDAARAHAAARGLRRLDGEA